MFNLCFLKTFVALAKTKSFRSAAHINSITQPAVSQQIRVLENKLNTTLIEFSGKSVNLTHAGETFLPYAENILNQIEEAQLQINEQANTYTGTIRIATIYSIGLYRLQALIKRFLKKYPKVSINLEYYHNNIIYEKILNRTVDFGFVAYPKNKDGLISKVFTEEKLLLVQSSERPAFKKNIIESKDLKDCKFVALSETTPTGKELSRIFKQKAIHLNIVHEFDNVETLKSAVLVGMGCAFVPEIILTDDLQYKNLIVVKVKGMELKRPLGILSPKGRCMTKAKQRFYDLVLPNGCCGID